VFCSNVGRRAGWFWWMLNFIFLKRDYEKDKKKIQAQLKSLVEKAKQYSTGNFWLMIFPEGTCLKPKKLAQAQAFSKEKGLPVFNHCLVPRIKGLQASIDGVRDAVDGILDVTVGYTERDAKGKIQPSLETILFGKGVSRKIHVHVAFVPISEIPSDSDGIYKWTMERFVIKDKYSPRPDPRAPPRRAAGLTRRHAGCWLSLRRRASSPEASTPSHPSQPHVWRSTTSPSSRAPRLLRPAAGSASSLPGPRCPFERAASVRWRSRMRALSPHFLRQCVLAERVRTARHAR
jgi:hypothetical protein